MMASKTGCWRRFTATCVAVGIAIVLSACGGGSDSGSIGNATQINGQLTGLNAGSAVVLQLRIGDAMQEATVQADGSFVFPEPVQGAFSYRVTIRSQPQGQICAVQNGQGTVEAGGSPAPVMVVCAASGYRLSGTVAGNAGVLTIANAVNGDIVNVEGNGGFGLAQAVLAGQAYDVTVQASSAGQVCTVAQGSGTASADVSDIAIHCAPVAPPEPVAVPAIPGGLAIAYDVKAFRLSWTAVEAPAGGGAVTYRVFEDADGPGTAAYIEAASGITTNIYTHAVSGLLNTRLNASYRVQACNSAGCSESGTAETVDVVQAIGYFKTSPSLAGLRQFGGRLALSSDASTLAVGGNNGVVVYARVGGVWTHQADVQASNMEAGDGFGLGIALSADGSAMVVGARREDSNATGVGGDEADNSSIDSGAAYVFSRSAGAWSQQAYLKASNTDTSDEFGYAVAMSGDGNTVAVSAQGEDSGLAGVQTDNSAAQAGAVYVFTREGGQWQQQAYLKAGNVGQDDQFGYDLSLSADGSVLAIGAPGEAGLAAANPADNSGPGAGAAYVHGRNGSAWTQLAYLKASNAEAGDSFGSALALSGDGTTLAVGAWREASASVGVDADQADNAALAAGAVYVFTQTGASWPQQAYLKASNAQTYDRFGMALSLSRDGNTLGVAAMTEQSAALGFDGDQADNSQAQAGAAYLFRRAGNAWAQQAYVKATNSGAGDLFGTSLALSGDAGTLAVGASNELSAATGINGSQGDDATGADYRGAVYLY